MEPGATELKTARSVVIYQGRKLSADGHILRFPQLRDWAVISMVLRAHSQPTTQRISLRSLAAVTHPRYSLSELQRLISNATPGEGFKSLLQIEGPLTNPYLWTDAQVKTVNKSDPVAEVVIALRGGFPRLAMSSLLERSPEINITGSVGNGDDLAEAVEEKKPDVLFTSLDLPPAREASLDSLLRELSRKTAIVLLTPTCSSPYSRAIGLNPLSPFISAFVDIEDYQESINGILAAHMGKDYASQGILRAIGVEKIHDLLELVRSTNPKTKLTFRELEALRMLGRGFTNHEVAGRLVTNEKTVETYRQHILKKVADLGINQPLHRLGLLTGLALSMGLIGIEDIGVG